MVPSVGPCLPTAPQGTPRTRRKRTCTAQHHPRAWWRPRALCKRPIRTTACWNCLCRTWRIGVGATRRKHGPVSPVPAAVPPSSPGLAVRGNSHNLSRIGGGQREGSHVACVVRPRLGGGVSAVDSWNLEVGRWKRGQCSTPTLCLCNIDLAAHNTVVVDYEHAPILVGRGLAASRVLFSPTMLEHFRVLCFSCLPTVAACACLGSILTGRATSAASTAPSTRGSASWRAPTRAYTPRSRGTPAWFCGPYCSQAMSSPSW